MSIALIMAGGRSERMRKSLGVDAKPLVHVLGASLVERNLMALLREGLREIVVATPATGNADLDAWISGRGSALAAAAGARLTSVREAEPRGNIGIAGDFHGKTEDLIVVFADNLTTLPLGAVLADHRASRADLTLAVHDEPFAMPYGEIEVRDGRVTAYREKPVKRYTVCSAVSVLGPRALAVLHEQGLQPVGLSDLFRLAAEHRLDVRAHEHAERWIDVNDADALAKAETMLLGARELFDCWASHPASGAIIVAGAADRSAVCRTRAAASTQGWRDLGVFDDVDETGQAVRFTLLTGPRDDLASHGEGWLEGERLTQALQTDGAVRRGLAIVQASA